MGKGYLAWTHVIAQSAYDAAVQVQSIRLVAIFPEPVKKLWLQVSGTCLVTLATVYTGNRMLTKLCVSFFTGGFDQINTVYGTRIPAKVAARAVSCDDGVHQLVSTNDSIYRAGSNAQCAADAFLFPDDREHGWCEFPTFIVECKGFASQ